MAEKDKMIQVHVIDASAGSGKTYALAKEYLAFLMNPALKAENIPQKSILAITFTNKATNEMKQRILEFLKKIALDAFSSPAEKEDILSGLGGIDRKAAQKRAYAIIELIIRNFDFFRVQTIDSFINSVITGCSFNLDISSGFTIETNYQPYLDYCLDELIELSLKDRKTKEAFMEFISHYLSFEEKPNWFPKQKISEIIKRLFECSNTYGLPFEKHDEITGDAILAMKKETFSLMKKLAGCLPEGANGRFASSVTDFTDENTCIANMDGIPPCFNKDRAVPMNTGASCPAKVSELFETILENLGKISESEAFTRYSPYVAIYDMTLKGLKAYTQKEDVLFLSELNKKAKSLFDSKTLTVPELYYRLATRFRYYLVDEFQDTSRLQWANLLPMVEEALASGGSLFYVGDKKQAIYGFRGGEYGLFDEVKGHFRNSILKEDVLDKNYRSQKEIVEFNNTVFSTDNLIRFLQDYDSRDGLLAPGHIDEIAGIFVDSTQKRRDENNRGYVKVEEVQIEDAGQKNELISRKLIKLIQDLKKREFDYGEICVLLRDNNDVELVTGWLLENKIPVESEKTLNIRENPLIKELFSFLSFLRFQPDNIAFASFLLGDIFTKETKIDIKTLQDFIFDAGQAKGRFEKIMLYVKFREKYRKVWDDYIGEFTARAGLVPLYELVISILSRYNVLKNFPRQQGFIMAFLELIRKQEQENCGLEAFIDYFLEAGDAELFVNVTSSNSVKAMTIHKAKGLEFAVVITPFLDINNIELKKKISQDFVIRPDEKGLSLVRVHKKYCRFSPLIQKMYAVELKKSLIEELNAAYVAFTRAKNELYIFIPYKKDENIARLLIPETNLERGNQVSYKEKNEKEPDLKEIPPSDYSDWLKLIEYEFEDKFRVTNRSLIQRGSVVHYMLSSIQNMEETGIDALFKDLERKTIKTFPYFTGVAGCLAFVKSIVNHKDCKKLFFVRPQSAFNEQEIVDSHGNTKRPDRLILAGKEAWVVDYKISEKESENHKKQIMEYMRIISEIYPDRKARGFLLYATEKNITLKEIPSLRTK